MFHMIRNGCKETKALGRLYFLQRLTITTAQYYPCLAIDAAALLDVQSVLFLRNKAHMCARVANESKAQANSPD